MIGLARMFSLFGAAVFTLVMLMTGLLQATDYHVDCSHGDDGNDGLSWATAFKTIQRGVNEAGNVHVAAGTYYEHIEILETTEQSDRDILGGYPPGGGARDARVNETIIDAGGERTVVRIENSHNLLFDGFTVRNGYASWGTGGIDVYESSPTISNCFVTENFSGFGGSGGIDCCRGSTRIKNCLVAYNEACRGGGIGCACNSTATVEDCVVVYNTAGVAGAGIECFEAGPTIRNCWVSDNSTEGGGGGIDCDWGSAEIANCELVRNSAESGGGIRCIVCSPRITNCIVALNSADVGGAFYCAGATPELRSCNVVWNSAEEGGFFWCTNSTPKVVNSIVIGNVPYIAYEWLGSRIDMTFSCAQDDFPGEGNFDADPLFVPIDDAPFYLMQYGPQATDSPCIDAGKGIAADYGLEGTTTCTDGRPDAGPIDVGYHYANGYSGYSPMYIELVSFEAQPTGSCILVTWVTGAEIDKAAFFVFRSHAEAQDYCQVSGLIPARGMPASGASYRFTDCDVEPQLTYEYWLVDIDTRGDWKAHGPKAAAIQ